MTKKTRTSSAGARQQRSAETRATILAAAEQIFADAGLAGARTDAIAAAAGVNKALLYYYFKSKEDLYRAVVEDHLRELRRQSLEVLSSGGSVRSILLHYVSNHFDFINAHPYYPRLFQRLMMTGRKQLKSVSTDHFLPPSKNLVDVIERGVRSGELRRVDSHHAAISLVALSVFYFAAAPVIKTVANIDPYAKGNLKRRKEEVLNLVRYGLFRNPEEPVP